MQLSYSLAMLNIRSISRHLTTHHGRIYLPCCRGNSETEKNVGDWYRNTLFRKSPDRVQAVVEWCALTLLSVSQ